MDPRPTHWRLIILGTAIQHEGRLWLAEQETVGASPSDDIARGDGQQQASSFWSGRGKRVLSRNRVSDTASKKCDASQMPMMVTREREGVGTVDRFGLGPVRL